MASSSVDGDPDDPEREIRLVKSDDWWVATDVESGVTSQGESRTAALENLDEAVALYRGEIGRADRGGASRGRHRYRGQRDRVGTAP